MATRKNKFGRQAEQKRRFEMFYYKIECMIRDRKTINEISNEVLISTNNLRKFLNGDSHMYKLSVNIYASKRNERMGKMAENGYMMHSISAAIGVSTYTIVQQISKDFALDRAFKRGYDWRAIHPLKEWPDYIMSVAGRLTLVGCKSAYWDRLPFAEQVVIPDEPVTYFDTVEVERPSLSTYKILR